MATLTNFFMAIPSLIVTLIWAAGIALTLRHPTAGSWRGWAIGGFGCLIVVSLLGLVPLMMIGLTPGGYSSMIPILTLTGLVGGLLGIVGAGLLVTAVLTSRGPNAQAPTATPAPPPYPPGH